MFRFTEFAFDPHRAELLRPDGQTIRLRPQASALLQFFIDNNKRILSKHDLMEAGWPGIHVAEDSLFQCIREIRKALGDEARQTLRVVSRRGYILSATAISDGLETAPDGGDADRLPSPRRAAPRPFVSRTKLLSGAFIVIAALAGLTYHFIATDQTQPSSPPVIDILPIADLTDDPQSGPMIRGITNQLLDGLARTGGVQVRPPEPASSGGDNPHPGFQLQQELERSAQAWTLRTRIIDASTREIRFSSEAALDADVTDEALGQTRLAASAGYAIATWLDQQREAPFRRSPDAANAAIEQAISSINQTTKERFATARSILETYLAQQPDNVDLQVALAALHLRGIQLSWYGEAEKAKKEEDARALIENALKSRPMSANVLGTYCRFLAATNAFSEALVACARDLDLNPWDGGALFNLGLTQIQLGRFEDALSTFQRADRFNTPDVSRWTWLLGAGWANVMLERDEEALTWLQRAIAITPGTGRAHMLLAVAYQRLGRTADAKNALAQALKLRPGSTASNISLPAENVSQIYLDKRQEISNILIELGLPPG